MEFDFVINPAFYKHWTYCRVQYNTMLKITEMKFYCHSPRPDELEFKWIPDGYRCGITREEVGL